MVVDSAAATAWCCGCWQSRPGGTGTWVMMSVTEKLVVGVEEPSSLTQHYSVTAPPSTPLSRILQASGCEGDLRGAGCGEDARPKSEQRLSFYDRARTSRGHLWRGGRAALWSQHEGYALQQSTWCGARRPVSSTEE